jgi:hypothetical protein
MCTDSLTIKNNYKKINMGSTKSDSGVIIIYVHTKIDN